MKRQILLAVTGALSVLSAGSPRAADENGDFALKGAGFLPCQVFVDEREQRSSVYYMIAGWLEGFVSAHNRYSAETYDIASFESTELLLSVMQNHCQANPNDRLYSVINSIIIKLNPDRVQTESPKVEIADGQRQTQLYRETIRKMQERLAALGLFKEAADGRYTDATRSALMAFQTDLGFEVTGFPDQTTLWRLFRE